jgi:hypothetical protein
MPQDVAWVVANLIRVEAQSLTMAKRKRRSEKATVEYPGHIFSPLEVADFVQAPIFTKEWARLGLTDDDLRILEILIMTSAKQNPVIRGTDGLRKIRFSPPGWTKGKSGALRCCYVYFEEYRLMLLVLPYKKSEKDDLTPAGRKAARCIIQRQRNELSKRPLN